MSKITREIAATSPIDDIDIQLIDTRVHGKNSLQKRERERDF
jgi:hypothetical protein